MTKVHCLVVFTSWLLGNMSIAIVCSPGYDVVNLEINLIYLIKPFFLPDLKVKTKT